MSIFLLIPIGFSIVFFISLLKDRIYILETVLSLLLFDQDQKEYMKARMDVALLVFLLDYTVFIICIFLIAKAIYSCF